VAVQHGKLSSYGYHQALQGLWGGVAGLVSRESMEIITAAQREFQGGLTDTKRSVTVIGDVVAVVVWQIGTDKVEIVLKKPGMAGVSKHERSPDGSSQWALRRYLEATKKFSDQPGALSV
jgi:hypothetical protein